MDEIIKLYKKHLDVSLIKKNLSLSVEERFLQLMELQKFADELKKSGAQRQIYD